MTPPSHPSAPEDFRAWVATLPPRPGLVRVEGPDDAGVARIVLDAPATRNALTPQMMVGLADAVAASRGARAVVLHGAGGRFCSGGDLVAVRDWLAFPGMGRVMGGFMHGVLSALEALEVPLVGVLEGAAMGGGAELLAACDVVVAAPNARLGWVQTRLGVAPGFGGGARLARRVGDAAAREIIATAPVFDAATAQGRGLVDVVDAAPLACGLAIARARAGERVARVPIAAQVLATELATFDAVWGGEAHQAALPPRT